MATATRAPECHPIGHADAPDPPRRETRLMVVDDHTAVRIGVARLLEEQEDFHVECVCVDADDAAAQPSVPEIDLAVVDYHLGGRNGLWLCRRLKQHVEPPRVIIYSAFADDHLAACSAVAGADGLLNKQGLGEELCDAVRLVARGRRVMPPVSRPVAEMLSRRLSEGEQTLFEMLLSRAPRFAIRHRLGMSARELDSRAAAMLRKLEIPSGGAPVPSWSTH